MYGYSSVHVQTGANWVVEDLSSVPFSAYTSRYNEVRITLTNPNLENPGELRITNPIKDLVNAAPTDTLDTWLTKNDDTYITHTHPVTDWDNLRSLVMTELMAAGYDVTPANPNVAPDADVDPLDCQDLFVSKEGVTGHTFAANMLAVVNGLVHRTIGVTNGAYIMGGYHNVLTTGNCSIHAICTEAVSSFKTYDFKGKVGLLDVDMNRMIATIDVGVDLSDNPLALVLGGFLYLTNECYKLVSPSKIRIDLNQIPLAQRHMHHYSAITPNISVETRTALNQDVYDAEGLIRLLEHPCTFLVAFDTAFDRWYCDTDMLENTFLAGKYLHKKPVKGIPFLDDKTIAGLYTWTNGDNLVSSTERYTIPQYEFYNMAMGDVRSLSTQCNRFAPGQQSDIIVRNYFVL